MKFQYNEESANEIFVGCSRQRNSWLMLLSKGNFQIISVGQSTVKILLEAHALKNAHPPVWIPLWTPKMPIFQANFPKNQAPNKPLPMYNEKKQSVLPYAEKFRIYY